MADALIDEEEDYDDGHAIPRPTGPPWIALPLATVKELLAEHRTMHNASDSASQAGDES